MGENAYVYFMASTNNNALYVGVTSDLIRRVYEHKNHTNLCSFTDKYHCHKLIYVEHSNDIKAAIAREKQLKNWKREWKDALIEQQNPQWIDLSIEYGIKTDCGSSPQ